MNRFMSIFAVLPLFFSWLLIFTITTNQNIKKISIYSGINSFIFFALFFLSLLLSIMPFIGSWIASIIHLIAVLIYFSFSIFLLYSIILSKTIEISKLDQIIDKLSFLLEEKHP